MGSGAVALLLLLPLFLTSTQHLHVLTMIFLYGLMGIAWNLIGGYAGQVSFGHAVFFGTGAYTSTLLMIKAGISPILGMLVGGLVAAALSLVIGYGCFRLAGHYFAIATFTVGEVAHVLAATWQYIGAAVGIYVPLDRQHQWWLTLQFESKAGYYYLALALLAVAVLVSWQIGRSRMGYYFRAIKGDPEAARALGINISRQKMYAMAASAFLMALAGAFQAQYVLFIDPDSVLGGQLSIMVCLIAVLGGAGSLWGPVVGAAVLIPLSEYTRAILGGSGQGLDLLIYGLMIVVVSVYQPEGLVGLWSRIRGLLEKRGASRVAAGS